MKNPFNYEDKLNSDEMKALLKELEMITAKVCLLHAEEQGTEYDSNLILNVLQSRVQMESVKFKCFASHKLSIQPESELSDNDKIAVAAHEVFKFITRKHNEKN